MERGMERGMAHQNLVKDWPLTLGISTSPRMTSFETVYVHVGVARA